MSAVAAGEKGKMAQFPAEQQRRRWIKYYCDECRAWETREMFEVAKFEQAAAAASAAAAATSEGGAMVVVPPSPKSCAVWSWGCAKLIRHGTEQSFRVETLNNADGHDLAANQKLDFPTTNTNTNTNTKMTTTTSSPSAPTPLPPEGSVDPPPSNGSSQLKRNGRDSPANSQGGVTSSSRADERVPDVNGASTVHQEYENGHATAAAAVAAAANASATGADGAGSESPAVIDAEHHENGVYKRPRRLTAGDRGLAQALQFERPKKATTPKAASDVKPSAPSLAAAMKRPKRVTAGLKGMALAAENAKLAPRVAVKKEPKKDAVHQVSVQTRSGNTTKPSKKNKRLGDL